jgi:hypothetical protein
MITESKKEAVRLIIPLENPLTRGHLSRTAWSVATWTIKQPACQVSQEIPFNKYRNEFSAKERKDRKKEGLRTFHEAFATSSFNAPSCFYKCLTLCSLRSFSANQIPLKIHTDSPRITAPVRFPDTHQGRMHRCGAWSRLNGIGW